MKMKLVWLLFLVTGIAPAQGMEFQVEPMNRAATETSRKGDLVSARIISLSGFQGSIMEHKITGSESGAKGRALAALASNRPATAAAPSTPATSATPAAPETPVQSTGGSAQPDFTTLKDEFIPGENAVPKPFDPC